MLEKKRQKPNENSPKQREVEGIRRKVCPIKITVRLLFGCMTNLILEEERVGETNKLICHAYRYLHTNDLLPHLMLLITKYLDKIIKGTMKPMIQ